MKNIILLLATMATMAWAQTVPLPTPSSSTVNSASLPSQVVGGGTSWQRGNAYPVSGDFTFALRVGSSNWYSWTEGSTPIATVPAGSTQGPLATSFTTGGAWAAAQSGSGKVTLLVLVQVGFSTVQATSTTAPAFSGSMGVAIRPWLSRPLWIVPFIKAANPTAGSSGALATAIIQPGVQLLWGFGGK